MRQLFRLAAFALLLSLLSGCFGVYSKLTPLPLEPLAEAPDRIAMRVVSWSAVEEYRHNAMSLEDKIDGATLIRVASGAFQLQSAHGEVLESPFSEKPREPIEFKLLALDEIIVIQVYEPMMGGYRYGFVTRSGPGRVTLHHFHPALFDLWLRERLRAGGEAREKALALKASVEATDKVLYAPNVEALRTLAEIALSLPEKYKAVIAIETLR